jgi:hypothetical protein
MSARTLASVNCDRAAVAQYTVLARAVLNGRSNQLINFFEGREGEHFGRLRQQPLGVVIKQPQTRVMKHAGDESGRDVGGAVASAEEEGDEGNDEAVAEIGGEAERSQQRVDGKECSEGLESMYPTQYVAEPRNFGAH